MWILIIISFVASGEPVITTLSDFTSKRSCIEMQSLIRNKLHKDWPTIEMSCVYSED